MGASNNNHVFFVYQALTQNVSADKPNLPAVRQTDFDRV